MANKYIKPEDVLSEENNYALLNGLHVRKGTAGAFLANINLLESLKDEPVKQRLVLNMLRELAPAIVAIGFHQHVTFKNPVVEQIIKDAARSK